MRLFSRPHSAYMRGVLWAENFKYIHGFKQLINTYEEMCMCDMDYNDFNRGVEAYIDHVETNRD